MNDETHRRLAVVLPAYNEEANLRELVDRLVETFGELPLDCEIFVVDDGSADRTAAVAEELSRTAPVRLIRHPKNRGLGAAIRTGLTAATAEADLVVTMDADNTQNPTLIPEMVAACAGGLDLVIASRFQEGAAELGVPFRRRVLSHCASLVLRLFAPIRGARDYSCGYRLYRATLLRSLIERFGEDRFVSEGGFACMTELLLKCDLVGARVGEVPLVLRYDLKAGSSKIAVKRTVPRYASVVSRYWKGFEGDAALPAPVDQPASAPSIPLFWRWTNRGAALAALVILAIPMALLATLIRATTPGPVVIRERRVGLNRRLRRVSEGGRRSSNVGGSPFTLLRFRTEHLGPDGHALIGEDGDVVRTPLGAVLRRYHLDHLPQIVNVIRGDMQWVGPRPERPDDVRRLSESIEGYPERLSVPPGMTGAGQLKVRAIHAVRDQEARVLHDLRYLARRSIGEDIKLIGRTIVALLGGSKGTNGGGRTTLLGLVLFGALLRLLPMNVQSLTVDEVAALRNASLSFRKALFLPDSFPPLYTWISSLWVRLPTGGDASLRVLSALVGLAVIWAVYRSAARLGGARAGVFGGILAACSALVLHHAQEGRMYGLTLALAAVQFAFLVKALEAESKNEPDVGAWAGFGVTAVLGAYTHYYFAIWVGSCALATLVWFRGRVPLRAWLTFGTVLLLSLPLLLLVEGDTAFQSSLREPHPFDFGAIGYAYFTFLAGYGLGPSRTELSWMGLADALRLSLPWLAIFMVSAGGLVVAAFRRRLDRRRLELLLVLAIVPVLLTGIVGALVGVTFNPRFVVMAIVPILTLLGIGAGCEAAVAGKSATTRTMVLFVLLVSTQLFSWNRRMFDPRYTNEDVRAAARIMMENPAEATFVISDYMEIPLNHYLSESQSVESFLEANTPSQIVQTREQAETLVDAVFHRVGQGGLFRLVYTRSFHGDPNGLALEAFAVRATLELERELAGVRIYRGVVPRNRVVGLSTALRQKRSVVVDDGR